MIANIYSVFDKKSAKFGSPFLAANDKIAIRDFSLAVTSKSENLMTSFSEDFDLYRVGRFDDNSSEFLTPSDDELKPVFLINGGDIKKE